MHDLVKNKIVRRLHTEFRKMMECSINYNTTDKLYILFLYDTTVRSLGTRLTDVLKVNILATRR